MFALIITLVLIGQLILIGWLAQTKKGRTGAIWSLVTFVLDVGLFAFTSYATDPARRALRGESPPEISLLAQDVATAVMVFGPVTLLMLIVVATLPKIFERQRASPD
ncbi:hypothetical protein [Methylopila sp. M107]|uniref:hypothetical protein n=1 Tax=Methylopila sp. M107 TaxID=1101190 RepID=UPI000375830B|nr:hypothetical protein [Methylopila sp. M107]